MGNYEPQPPAHGQQQSGNYRYDNLALAANSYRAVGTLLKVSGALIVLCGPLLLAVGMNSDLVAGRCPPAESWCSHRARASATMSGQAIRRRTALARTSSCSRSCSGTLTHLVVFPFFLA